MDSRAFDRLARIIGAGRSRRSVLKSLAGGAMGAVAAAVGFGDAAAARCRGQGVVCSKNADCCSSACLPKDRTGRRVCAECGTAADCPPGDPCHLAVCAAGVCGITPLADGALCDNGDPATCNDICIDGLCTAGTPACGGTCCEGSDVCFADACEACTRDGHALPGGCTIDTVSLCCSGHCNGACCGDFCCIADGLPLTGGCNIDSVSTCCSGHCHGACCGDFCCVADGLPLDGGCNIDSVSLCCSGHCHGACCGDECL